jgi:hypothetical protein
MAKVFVISNMTHNYSSAEKFGKLVNVTEGKVPIFKTDTMISLLKHGLMTFSDDDYLLISGPALLCIMATTILFNKLGKIKLLVFDAKEQDYIVRHLDKEHM